MKLISFTKKLLADKDIKKIILLFLGWRVSLIAISFITINTIPLRGRDFLGGGFDNYIKAPWFYGWANFDGEHYLSIASIGYRGLEQAFFPVFPTLMNIFSIPFGRSPEHYIAAGLIISNLSFLLALIVLWKLILIDFNKKIAWLTLAALLMFPTSFYFVSLYNESLYLLLTVTSFYLMRKGRWFLASFIGGISSATRIFGMLLTPVYLIEAWQKRVKLFKFFWIFFIPGGLFAYMYYQWITVGDPLAFYHLQKIVGPQHESGITLLPQVYVRYVKILLTTPLSNPIYQTILLEFFIGILFFLLPLYGFFKKMDYSYIFYAIVGFILPTVQGSFSSVPRYVIILFPSFIIIAMLLSKIKWQFQVLFFIILAFWLAAETALFFRGYWVA